MRDRPPKPPLDVWHASLNPVTRGRAFDKAKETTRNHIRSLENAISNMEGKRLRQHRHDIEWHRKYILALGCMVLFLVGSLGALVGRGGLGGSHPWPCACFCSITPCPCSANSWSKLEASPLGPACG